MGDSYPSATGAVLLWIESSATFSGIASSESFQSYSFAHSFPFPAISTAGVVYAVVLGEGQNTTRDLPVPPAVGLVNRLH